MRKGDDVFLFTLVDFLLQLFFFGLVLYVLMQARASSSAKEAKLVAESGRAVSTWSGFSSITELNDFLSKLAPPEDFRGWADFLSREKSLKPVVEATAVVGRAGGAKEVERKIKAYDEAYGLPPCEKKEANGKTVPEAIGIFRLEDDLIAIESSSRRLAELREQIGDHSGPNYSLTEFKSLFLRLRQLYPNCRFFADVVVRTKFIAPMDAFSAGFRVNVRR